MAIEEFIDLDVYNKDLLFSQTDLSQAFVTQASLFAHYAAQAHKAAKQAASKKIYCEVLESKLDKDTRDAMNSAGEKITEKAVEKKIALNKAYISALTDKADAESLERLYRDLLEAIRQRKDMIIQAGCDAREEMKGDVRMKFNNIEDYKAKHPSGNN